MRPSKRLGGRRGRVHALGVALALLLAAASPACAHGGAAHARPEPPAPGSPLPALPGLRSLFVLVRLDVEALLDGVEPARVLDASAAARDRMLEAAPPGRRDQLGVRHALALGHWAEFERVAAVVLGRPEGSRLAYARALDAARSPARTAGVDAAVLVRDHLVLQLAVVGRPPHLIADAVAGRLPLAALVQAVIRHESGWDPTARSRKGALGLMQLMPDTARLLGVDPLDPEQNIDGGTRFLASLLTAFDGNLDAALVGYVGGPTYARSWLRGELVPNDEVRTYLRNVKASYRAAASR